MTALLHAANGLVATAGVAAAAFAGGALFGALHFLALWSNARLFTSEGSVLTAVAMQLGRFAVIVAALIAAARLGALPLLAAALGILVSRTLVLWRLAAVP